MPQFMTELDVSLLDDDRVWVLNSPLVYVSEIVGLVVVPTSLMTDFASVPRVPIVYYFYGNRAHRESVVHDYLFRINSKPQATFDQANRVFREAMICRGKSKFVQKGMYAGVCVGGRGSYHKRKVYDKL